MAAFGILQEVVGDLRRVRPFPTLLADFCRDVLDEQIFASFVVSESHVLSRYLASAKDTSHHYRLVLPLIHSAGSGR